MGTVSAIQCMVAHVRAMGKPFFSAGINPPLSSHTTFNGVQMVIRSNGFSSGTLQPSLHFVVQLEGYQPPGIPKYDIWINNPKEDDAAANQAAVAAGLEILITQGTWNTRSAVSIEPV
ncbi:hypothetical protein GSI_02546 [Ganoderma sinense ZZ0214-1]|uniref:Uncharacterized protein n=1 Tax=Ganoderma sinense ZZ0214-1 TaxID=1077348 RepID=A0A2G8SLY5_9APHY|nr:hypothetical protein GSI_02546 [Ganoderma sinense ZZ0214-1]